MAQTAIAMHDLGGRLSTLFGACAVPLDASLRSSVERAAQEVLRRMWQETGNAVSIQYAGTANLSQGSGLAESDQKKSLVGRATGLVEKGVRVANRYVQENFLEDSRQVGIDTLLMGGGAARRAPGLPVNRGTSSSDLSPTQRPRRASSLPNGNAPLSIFVGTWNVNGKFDAKTCSDEVRPTRMRDARRGTRRDARGRRGVPA
jgi:phosphatidylinositol-bisphosphatase